MSTILFLNKNIPDLETLSSSVAVKSYLDFEYTNIDFTDVNRIGFIWQNTGGLIPFGSTQSSYSYFTQEFLYFLELVNTKPTIVDLITCSFKHDNFITELQQILALYTNVTINYSINNTGNEAYGADWIMESSGENIKPIYFNDNIVNYKYTLDITPLYYNSNTNTMIDFANRNKIVTTSTTWSDIETYGTVSNTYNAGQFPTPMISIGFNFKLGSTTYTRFSVGTNGPILLDNTTSDIIEATSDAPLSTTLFSLVNAPYIVPLWTSMFINSVKIYKSLTVVVIEYLLQTRRGTTYSQAFKMQTLLYPDNSIVFKYKDLQTANFDASNNTNIFLTGVVTSNYYYTYNSQTATFDRKTTTSDISLGSYFTSTDLSNSILPNRTINFADLSGSDLSGYDLSGLNLTNVNLSNLNLTNVRFTGSNLNGATINDSILNGVYGQLTSTTSITSTNYTIRNNYILGPGVDLSGADLTNANLTDINLSGADLSKATLLFIKGKIIGTPILSSDYTIRNRYILGPQVNLSDEDLSGQDLSGINLYNSLLYRTTLTNVNVTNTYLEYVPMEGANINGIRGRFTGRPTPPSYYFNRNNYFVGANVNLIEADLSGANLSSIVMTGSDLSGANLTNVTLTNTTLTNVNLNNAILNGVRGQYKLDGTPLNIPSGYFIRNRYFVGPYVDLQSANLSGQNLANINLSFVNLTGANLTSVYGKLSTSTVNLTLSAGYFLYNYYIVGSGVDLSGVDLSGLVVPSGANLARIDLRGANLTNIDLSGATMSGAFLANATVTGVRGKFIGDLSSNPTNFKVVSNYLVGPYAYLVNADLTGGNMSNANITGINFTNANFTNLITGILSGIPANLPSENYKLVTGSSGNYIVGPNVSFLGIDLSNVDLSACITTGINFSGAKLQSVDLTGRDLSGSKLTNTDLSGAILNNTKVTYCKDALNISVLPNSNYRVLPISGITNGTTQTDQEGGVNFSLIPAGSTITSAYYYASNYSDALKPASNVTAKVVSTYERWLVNNSVTLVASNTVFGDTLEGFNKWLFINYTTNIYNGYLIGPNVDLTGANLAGYNISGYNFSNVNLTNANLTGVQGQFIGTPSVYPATYTSINGYFLGPNADLSGADLSGVNLAGFDLSGVNLYGANLYGVKGQFLNTPRLPIPTGYVIKNQYFLGPGVDLSGADISNQDLSGIDLTDAILTNANLYRVKGQIIGTPATLPTGYSLINRYLVGPNVELTGADLSNNNFTDSNLSNTLLTNSNLTNVNFTRTNLNNAVLTGATLDGVQGKFVGTPTLPSGYMNKNQYIVGSNVILSNADLSNQSLANINLTGTNLSGADLTNTSFDSVTFNSTNMVNTTLVNADFRNAVQNSALDLSSSIITGVKGQFASVNPNSILPSGYSYINRYIVGPGVDLSEADLSGQDLTGFNLAGTNLTNARLVGATLLNVYGQIVGVPASLPTGYVLRNSYIVGSQVNLANVDLSGVDLSGINLSGTTLTGANLSNVNLQNTVLTNVNLSNATVSGVYGKIVGTPTSLPTNYVIRNQYILGPNVRLQNADLTDVSLLDINLSNVDLSTATLTNVSGKLSTSTTGLTLPTNYRFEQYYIVGSNVNLTSADLSGSDLSGVILTGSDLTSSILTNVNLTNANMDNVIMTNANVEGIRGRFIGTPTAPSGYSVKNNYLLGPSVNLLNADLTNVDLSGINLSNVNLTGSTLVNVSGKLNITTSNLTLPTGYKLVNFYVVGSRVNLNNANLTSGDLSGFDLSGTNFSNATLTNSVLSNANLTNANLTSATLTNADCFNATFTGVTFSGTNLDSANLRNAHMANCNLNGSSFISANLTSANLTNANLFNCNLSTADLTSATLTGVKGKLNNATNSVTLPTGYTIRGYYIIGPNVNLTSAELANQDLSNVDLTGIDVSSADFSGTVLYGVKGAFLNTPLYYPNNYSIIRQRFIGPQADLTGVDLSNVDFTGIDLTGTNFTSTNLVGVRGAFIGTPINLPFGYFSKNNYFVGPYVDLSGADLTNVDFTDIDLTGVNIRNANLTSVKGAFLNQPLPPFPMGFTIINRHFVGPTVDLSGVDLSNQSFVDLDLSGSNLRDTDLRNVNVSGTNLQNVNMLGSNVKGIKGAFLGTPTLPLGYVNKNQYIVGPEVNLTSANLSSVDFTNIDLSGTDLSGATLTNVKGQFTGTPIYLPNNYVIKNQYFLGPSVDLSGANLSNQNLSNINLDNADLTNANLYRVYGQVASANSTKTSDNYRFINRYLVGPDVDLQNVDLSRSNLSSYDLSNVLLTSANLTNVNLSGTNLVNADLSGAVVNGIQGAFLGTPLNIPSGYQIKNQYLVGPYVNLSNSDLTNVNLDGIDLTSVDLSGATVIGIRGRFIGTPTTLPTSYQIKNQYLVGPYAYLASSDLSNQDLSGIDLTSSNLTSVDLRNSNLSGLNLGSADLSDANLYGVEGRFIGTPSVIPAGYQIRNQYFVGPGVKLINVVLTNQNLTGINLMDVNLSNSDLSGTNMSSVMFNNTNMARTNLSGVDFTDANQLTAIDLSASTLYNVKGQFFQVDINSILPIGYRYRNRYIVGPNVNLEEANLINANLTNFNLNGTNLDYADLTGAILEGVHGRIYGNPNIPGYYIVNRYIVGPQVDLSGSDLSTNSLSGYDLSGADLRYADLTNVNISNTNLQNVKLFGATVNGIRGKFTGVPQSLPDNYTTINQYLIGPYVNLVNADLSGASLQAIDLTNVDLSGANLYRVSGQFVNTPSQTSPNYIVYNNYLVGPDVDLSNSDLTNLELTNLNLSNVLLNNANLSGVNGQMTIAPLENNLPTNYFIRNGYILGPNVKLVGADLTDVDLSGINLTGVDMSEATMNGVKGQFKEPPSTYPTNYNQIYNYFVGPYVNLSGVDFSNANFEGFNLTNANMTNTTLVGVYGKFIGNPSNYPNNYRIINQYFVGPGVNLSNITNDLLNQSFAGINLYGANFMNTDLTNVDLSGVEIDNNTNFTGAVFNGIRGRISGTTDNLPTNYIIKNSYILGPRAYLQNVDLSNQDFSDCNLTEANLSEANLTSSTFNNVILSNANLSNANLYLANLSNYNLFSINLSGADLSGAILTNVSGKFNGVPVVSPTYLVANNHIVGPQVNLSGADLSNSNITGIDLTQSNLGGTDLTGAILTNVSGKFIGDPILPTGYRNIYQYIVGPNVNLSSVDLSYANISGIDLTGVNFSGGNLTNANLTNVRGQLANATSLVLNNGYNVYNRYIVGPNVNLSGANISNNDFTDQDFTGINMTNVDLRNSILTRVRGRLGSFSGIKLTTGYVVVNRYIVGPSTDLSGVDLYGQSLSNLNVTGTILTRTDLRNANLNGLTGRFIADENPLLSANYIARNNYIVGPGVDLTSADLSNQDLSGIDFTNTILQGTNMTGSTLDNVSGRFTGSPTLPTGYKKIYQYIVGSRVNLTGVDLSNSVLSGFNMSFATLVNTNLTNVDLSGTDLSGAIMTGSILNGVKGKMVGTPTLPTGYYNRNQYIVGPQVNLTSANLSSATLVGLDLSGAKMISANLTNVDISGANLTNVDLFNTTLGGIRGRFIGTLGRNKTGYMVKNQYIIGYKANLSNADLSGEDLSNLSMLVTNFTGANLTNVNITNAIIALSNFTNATLNGIKGQYANYGDPDILPTGYRFTNRYIVGPYVNLSGADLSNQDLSNVILTDINLSSANLSLANMTNANITGANMNSADLTGATITGIQGRFSGTPTLPNGNYQIKNQYIVGPGVNLTSADLTNQDLTGISFQETTLASTNMTGSTLLNVSGSFTGSPILPTNYRNVKQYIVGPGVNLANVDLSNQNLSNCDLSGAIMTSVDLRNATFTGVKGQINDVSGIQLNNGYNLFNRYIVGPQVNLTNADLSNQDLSGQNISGATVVSTNLTNVNLTNTDLTSADLTGAQVIGVYGRTSSTTNATPPTNYAFKNRYVVGPSVILTDADLSGQSLVNIDLSGCVMTRSILNNVDLSGATLTNVDLSGASVDHIRGRFIGTPTSTPSASYQVKNNYLVGPTVNLTNADLSGVDLSSFNLSNVNLTGADMTSTNLLNVNFTGVYGQLGKDEGIQLNNGYSTRNRYIVGANVRLVNADLSNQNMNGISLRSVDMTSANLSNTDLSGCDLSGVNMTNANLLNTKTWPIINGFNIANLPNGNYIKYSTFIIGPDLNLANSTLTGTVSNSDLSGTDLSGANLENVTFSNVRTVNIKGNSIISNKYTIVMNNSSTKFIIGPGVNLSGINFSGVDFTANDMTDADLSGVDLAGCNLDGTDLSGINFYNVKPGPFTGTPINLDPIYKKVGQFIIGPKVNLAGLDLTSLDLSACDLTGVTAGPFIAIIDPIVPVGFFILAGNSGKFIVGSGTKVSLAGVKLNNINLENIVIDSTSELNETSCFKANLSGTSIQNNNVNFVMFVGANLSGSDFSNTKFTRCVFINCTVTSSTVLTNVEMDNCYIKNTTFSNSSTFNGLTFTSCTFA